MPYKYQYGLAIAVAIIGAMIAAINAAGPRQLGLTNEALNWINVLSGGFIVLASVLPNVRRPPEPDVHYRD